MNSKASADNPDHSVASKAIALRALTGNSAFSVPTVLFGITIFAAFAKALSALIIIIFYRFFSWLQENADVFALHVAS